MSIVQSIDTEISGVKEEIEQLEGQLAPKRDRLDGLLELRQHAEALDAKPEGGGLAEPATRPRPKQAKTPRGPKAARKPQVSVVDPDAPFHEQVLEHIRQHPGCRGSDIATAFGIGDPNGQSKVSYTLKRLAGESKIDFSKVGSAKEWEAVDRPKKAPTPERRAASAPAPKPEPRQEPDTSPPPDSPAKQAHNAMRDRVRQAITELVADSEPITGDEITTMVLEQVPEAEREDVQFVRVALSGGGTGDSKKRVLEQTPQGYRLVARSSATAGPITTAERESVNCLGSGRTAREVAANCESIRDATGARAILEGLVRRNVVRRREGSDPTVYEGQKVGVS